MSVPSPGGGKTLMTQRGVYFCAVPQKSLLHGTGDTLYTQHHTQGQLGYGKLIGQQIYNFCITAL